jgi:transposase
MPTERKECPLCGEPMERRHTEVVVQIPGNPTATTRSAHEWVCPECEYFEEADGEGT